MKKITLSLIAACAVTSAFSQVVLQENFNEPFNPTAAGWIVQNNSIPSGTVSWTQGNQTGGNNGLVAYNGNTDDFYMADFMSVQFPGQGGISAFLITPQLTIYNGAVLQFATRTASFTAPNIFPDRMQVLMSQVVSPTIPTGTTSVGPFTTVLLDINQGLSTSNSTIVVGNGVNGYPMAWTVYSIPVAGVTGTVQGRFAFRYFVNDGGSNGANSRLIGLDAVRYTLPCGATASSFTTCPSGAVTLSATGGLAATTYSWSNGTSGASNNVNPASTTVYTLTSIVNGLACQPLQTATVTIGSQLGFPLTVNASTTQICSGRTVTLSVTNPASSYIWGTLGGTTPLPGNGSAITVTPGVTTSYTVGAQTTGGCIGTNTIIVNVIPSPQPSITIAPVCAGGNLQVSVSGASTYTFLGQSANPASFVLTAIGATNTGVPYSFNLFATGANGCLVGGSVGFTVNALPTVAITATVPAVVCFNRTVTLTGTGAATYSWSGASTATTAGITYSTGTTTGTKSFTVIGIDANGCRGTATKSFSVSACTGIETIGGSASANVFPNPFTNELNLTGLEGRVELFNALGELVLSTLVNNTEVLNTSELAKGVYILKAYSSSNEVEKTIKLMKN